MEEKGNLQSLVTTVVDSPMLTNSLGKFIIYSGISHRFTHREVTCEGELS